MEITLFNIRPVDSKFWLSGGWADVPEDSKWLALNEFRAVLDLQFVPPVDTYFYASSGYIKDELEKQGINYLAIPMADGENPNLKSIFEVGYNQIIDWDEKFTHRRDKILIKCGVGVSRSVAMLINYYCVKERLTFTESREKIRRVERFNGVLLPISIDSVLEQFLRNSYPDMSSAFGERE